MSAKPPGNVHSSGLFDSGEWPEPGFAAFVSSVIEGGVDPSEMDGIRAKLKDVGPEPYVCLSPALIDYLACKTGVRIGLKGPETLAFWQPLGTISRIKLVLVSDWILTAEKRVGS